jgi:hypothetical protein
MSKLYVNEIASKTGSTTAMTIDSSGRILKGTPVYANFSNANAPASLGASASFVELIINNVKLNSGGFALASNAVEVPLTGAYRWSMAMQINNTAAIRAMSLALYKNGNIDNDNLFSHFAFSYDPSPTHNYMTVSSIFTANAGDDMSLNVREFDGNVCTVQLTSFAIDYIG